MEARLEEELERLEARLGLSHVFKVVWMPNAVDGLSGEVKGTTIYIYEAEEKAMQALRHEVLDHLMTSRIVKTISGPDQPTDQGKRGRDLQGEGENS